MYCPECIRFGESLKKHSSLQIGGLADYFAEPSTQAELNDLICFAKEKKLKFMVIGNGTNLLFADEGFRGLIIKLGKKYSSISQEGDIITVQAGTWMPFVARFAQTRGLSGLEHTIGIPGTVGGVVTMNGGSQRKSIGDNIESVRTLSDDGVIKDIKAADCNFQYRKSIFQNANSIVVSVSIKCEQDDPKAIRKRMYHTLRERRHKFPLKEPNCGSVFKSDPLIYQEIGPPGKIIEDIGLKGLNVGDIYISKKHANFFVNQGNGTASDFNSLAELVDEQVFTKHHIRLEREYKFVNYA